MLFHEKTLQLYL